MKKGTLALLLASLLLLTSCQGQGGGAGHGEEEPMHILATTYPVYLFTTALMQEMEGVEVSLLVNQPVSCLHDYTLTVPDMRAIEQADIIVMNGVGLEDFMVDALEASSAKVVDSTHGLALEEAHGHEGHNHSTQYDPHTWMSPELAAGMMENIASGLEVLTDRDYQQWLEPAQRRLEEAAGRWRQSLDGLENRGLITFHDGFAYFAHAFDLDLIKSIEEEEGSEASAADIKEVVELVECRGLPAIFTEVNGSEATAEAIARETGVGVYRLNMIMSGEGTGLQPYLDAMDSNIKTLVEALR